MNVVPIASLAAKKPVAFKRGVTTALSIIVPVIDEAPILAAALQGLAPLRSRGAEVILVDGGSNDGTVDLARPLADRLIVARRGRATQMNAGAAAACGDVLLFLHADTRLPDHADRLVVDGLARSGRQWGRFDVGFDGGGLLRLVAAMMNIRSRLTGICTGDQAIFITRAAFDAIGGFPSIALMEDIAVSTRLKRVSRPLCLRARVTTSGRRWRKHGVLRTILLMWRLRLAYFFGADPAHLADQYGDATRQKKAASEIVTLAP
jgi:rSAM/selenodomain-associated transferase 2